MALVLSIWQVRWGTCTFHNGVSIQSALYHIVCVWIPRSRLCFAFHAFSLFFFFFFFFWFSPQLLTSQLCTVYPYTVHGSHKLHFSVTLSPKMGPTALFTYLKIISLQCFQFQFSVFSFTKTKLYPNGPYRHTLVISEYGLNFPPTSYHKYELVFLSKMFSREIEINFLVCCNTISFILTPATPNFSCS